MSKALIPVSHQANAALVKQAKLFAELPQVLLEKMQRDFHVTTWHKGQYISADVLMQQFFVLLEGQVELKKVHPETAREATVDIFYPGDSFDVMVLLDGKPHEVIIAPLNTVRLLNIPIETMRQWIWTYPEVNNQFLPYLAQKMREHEQRATSLVLHDTSTRLSRLILKHIDKINSYKGAPDCEHNQHLVNGLNDETLARMVGSVRQVVNKQLRHWQAQGILEKKRNQLIIKDLQALEQEAHFDTQYGQAQLIK
ncbi:Crp/Fnr family transcriptional regulator [Colwellia psychrerythraea]|uniref:Putative transcriptional regulator, Crp/Fnr family n=1 Tax=Colwellia psychrerythraea TaxID=28229 RepID=A0A099KAH2_COLPS|nr:Crp/Fnr family transcriptional regulator [Colwellia psychrerythraea]KGJ87356.1 putative transcriptional regulator, Crp/Fnr family [Colwellia psychrerythraea]